jgi:hypothetical protein
MIPMPTMLSPPCRLSSSLQEVDLSTGYRHYWSFVRILATTRREVVFGGKQNGS